MPLEMAAGENNSEASSNGMVDSAQDNKEVEHTRHTKDDNQSEASTSSAVTNPVTMMLEPLVKLPGGKFFLFFFWYLGYTISWYYGAFFRASCICQSDSFKLC